MLRMKLFIVCLVAVAAVGATACASASAHEFVEEKCENNSAGRLTKYLAQSECEKQENPKEQGSWQHIELFNSEIVGESEPGQTAALAGTIAGEKIVVGCAKTKIVAGTGSVGRQGKSKVTLEYSECSLFSGTTGEKFGQCKVPNITTKPINDSLEGSPVEDKFEPATPSTFAEIEVTGVSCLEKISKQPVTGTQTCALPEAGIFKRLHIIHCLGSGSTLKFDNAPATYSGLFSVRLVSELPWAAL